MSGLGVDLVHVPGFAAQLAQPGSRFPSVFTVGERAEAVRRMLDGDRLAAYWAARWGAREALVKAWSSVLFGQAPPAGDDVLGQIEVATDAWGRPRLVLHGEVADALAAYDHQVSLSHDGDHAIAVVLLEERRSS
ncbi:MAG TPA: holo-ACP synthase [Nocardioides sp.]|nr:holo-ACP synthase [Nocardioides sp.]